MKTILSWLLKIATLNYVRFIGKRPEILSADGIWPAPRTIAIVSNTALGDTLLSTPVVQSARSSFPEANIIFVTHPRWAKLFEGLEFANTILEYDGGFKSIFSCIRSLRSLHPNVVILAHSNGPQDIPLAIFSGAAIVLKPPTKSEYRNYLSYNFVGKPQHVIEERLDLLRLLGAQRIIKRMILPSRYSNPQTIEKMATKFIGMQLGAANEYKIWPIEYFADLATQLLNDDDQIFIVLTGSKQERHLGQMFKKICNNDRIIDSIGDFNIEALPQNLRKLSALVTNDTGTMHLAITLGIPTVSLFGTTSPFAIGPYQDLERHIVIHKTGPSQQHLSKKLRSNDGMKLISVSEVKNAVLALLKNFAI